MIYIFKTTLSKKVTIASSYIFFFFIFSLRPLFPGNDELDQIHKINLLLGSPSSRVLNKFRIQ